MGMMWGKEVVAKALLSDSREEEEELSLDEEVLSTQEKRGGDVSHLTFSVVDVLQERLELLLVENSALCVSLA